MTQPALPQGVLIAQAVGLANTEKAFPLGAPPIPIAQGLLSIASALPQTALPFPIPGAGGAGALPFPSLGGLSPLGGNGSILAALVPTAPTPNLRPQVAYARTGMG